MGEKRKIRFVLNHKEVVVETDPTDRLLDVIREQLNRKGTKEGCGIGECGACTVIMNGKCINSCVTMIAQVEKSEILTIEGLTEDVMADVIKTCFVEGGAVQCGFCTPGMILSAYVLLQENKTPSREEIKTAAPMGKVGAAIFGKHRRTNVSHETNCDFAQGSVKGRRRPAGGGCAA